MPAQRGKKKSLDLTAPGAPLLPIEGFARPGGTPATPAPPPASTPADAPQQNLPSAAPAAAPAPKNSAPPPGRPASFKLRESLTPTVTPEAAPAPEKKPVVTANDPFDASAVTTALALFLPDEGGIVLRTALTAHAPRIAGSAVVLLLDNELLLERTLKVLPALQSHLIEQLNHGALTVSAELLHEETAPAGEKRLFTAQDKFEHFAALNPAVSELRERLGLELE